MRKTVFLIFGFLTLTNMIAQQLDVLIEQAIANNPEIQKFEIQHELYVEKVNEVNTLPDTQFAAGYFISEPETRTGPQRAKISVKQSIPWFGAITARESYASSVADVKFEDLVIAKRKLVAEVSRSFYNLNTLESKKKVLVRNIKLLKNYETLALSSVENGKASAVDVLRIQMRQNDLEQLSNVIENEVLSEQSYLNKLLNRDSTILIQLDNELSIPIENELAISESLQVHPELTRYDKLYESVSRSELLNQKESSPMLGLGLDYIAVSERPDMSFSDNGKDIFMPMLSISIPVFTKKYRSITRQNELRKQEISAERSDRYNTLKSKLDRAINDRYSALIGYETSTKNIKQAKDAEEILMKNYETGTINFTDVLDVQELQIKFQLAQIEAIRQFFIQSTIINYLSN